MAPLRTAIKSGKPGKGRPTKYKDRFVEEAFELSRLGGEIKDLAKFFKTTMATVYAWKYKYDDFGSAILRGRDIFDSGEVGSSLLKRAIGYEFTEVREEKIPFLIKGKKIIYRTKVTVTRKQMAPDVKAQMFWLINRDKDRWGKVLNGGAGKGNIPDSPGDLGKRDPSQPFEPLIINSCTDKPPTGDTDAAS